MAYFGKKVGVFSRPMGVFSRPMGVFSQPIPGHGRYFLKWASFSQKIKLAEISAKWVPGISLSKKRKQGAQDTNQKRPRRIPNQATNRNKHRGTLIEQNKKQNN